MERHKCTSSNNILNEEITFVFTEMLYSSWLDAIIDVQFVLKQICIFRTITLGDRHYEHNTYFGISKLLEQAQNI